MVIHFKGQAERVHFSVALPTLFFSNNAHAMPQGFFGFIRQHRIDRNWYLGNGAAQQTLADPFAAQDGVIIHGIRVSDQPDRMSKNALALVSGKSDEMPLAGRTESGVGALTFGDFMVFGKPHMDDLAAR